MNRKKWVVIFFVLISLSERSILWADDVDDYYRSANKFYADKDYQHALDAYEGAIPYDKNPYRAYMGMGNCEYFLNQKSKAVEYYQKSLDLHPDTFLAQFIKKVKVEVSNAQMPAFKKGVDHLTNKNYKQAIPYFKEVTQYDLENMTAFYDLGYCYYSIGDKPDAALYFFYYGKTVKDDAAMALGEKMKVGLSADDREWLDAQLELGPPFSPPYRFSGFSVRLEPSYQLTSMKDFSNFSTALKAQGALQKMTDPTFDLTASSPGGGLGMDVNPFYKVADWLDVGLTGGLLFAGGMTAAYTDQSNPGGAQGSFSFQVMEVGFNVRAQVMKLDGENKWKLFLEANPCMYLTSVNVSNSDKSGTTAGWTFTPINGDFSSTGFGGRFKVGVDWKAIPNTVLSVFLGYQIAQIKEFKGTETEPVNQKGQLEVAPDSLTNPAIIFVPDGTTVPGAAPLTLDLSGVIIGLDFSVLL
jgi:hypothetical protein